MKYDLMVCVVGYSVSFNTGPYNKNVGRNVVNSTGMLKYGVSFMVQTTEFMWNFSKAPHNLRSISRIEIWQVWDVASTSKPWEPGVDVLHNTMACSKQVVQTHSDETNFALFSY